jgi:hypothetical protein
MCWNADISLNTFMFVSLALIFIWTANTFTKYKSSVFDNKLVYLFVLNVAAVQLVEFFLWKNLKNAKMNAFFSKIMVGVIVLQPILLMLMVPHSTLRNGLFLAFALAALLFFYVKNPTPFHTSVVNGHLSWDWINFKGYYLPLAVFCFYAIPLMAIHQFAFSLFAFTLIGIAAVNYWKYTKYQTVGSMWCWSTNLFLFLILADILILKPYREYNAVC